MGLFEKLSRTVERHGLANKGITHIPLLSFLMVVAGVAWLLVLPMDGQYRRTYISENALMPGQAHTFFREAEWNIARGYRDQLIGLQFVSEADRIAVFKQWFQDIGLHVAEHDWSGPTVDGDVGALNGTNVYGVMHAPRSDDTEAMVLAVPTFNKDGQYNAGALALMFGLARYFKRWSLWSKNVVFVISSDSTYSLRSWVDAYHTSLDKTAGVIEAALVLDYPSIDDFFDAVEISVEGLNGILPNLDLVNTISVICGHEYLPVYIHGNRQFDNHPGDYATRLTTLARSFVAQLVAGAIPYNGAEAFSGWRISAVTIRALGSKGPTDITTFGRVAEGAFRSINNLLEHFHQSFFFYYLLGPNLFVSIGTYLPAAMLLTTSFSLAALGKYLALLDLPNLSTSIDNPLLSMAIIVGLYGSCMGFGFACLSFGSPLLKTSAFVLGSLPFVLKAFKMRLSPSLAYQIQSMALAVHGLALTTLATCNFALAFSIALVTFPLTLVRPRMAIYKLALLLAVASPWAGLYYIGRDFGGFDQLVQGVLDGWQNAHVWTWPIVAGLWLPAWVISAVVGA